MDIKTFLKPTAARYDIAIAIVRIVVGIAFFMHGYQKLFQMGIGGVGGFFGSLGIPAAGLMAAVVTFVELLGGLALVLGIGTRIAAILLTIDMLTAMFVVHISNGFFVSNNGIELVFILGAACIAFAIYGPGAFSLDERVLT